MPPTTIHNAPSLDSFTALADHQSQTPASFFAEKPILHYYAIGARVLASRDQVTKLPIFADGPAAENADSGVDTAVETVDVFVSSENLTLFNKITSIGLSIPYPAISLHAIQRFADPADASKQIQGLYMQLELSDPYGGAEEDDDEDFIEITLVPNRSDHDAPPSDIQALFNAVSTCSNLNPDPADGDEDIVDGRIVFEGNVGYEGISGLPGVVRGSSTGDLPPPFPGSGGWITADNVSQYFDSDGNWIGENASEPLGEGAGRVRGREEVERGEGEGQGDADGETMNGDGGEGGDDAEEHKRIRTE